MYIIHILFTAFKIKLVKRNKEELMKRRVLSLALTAMMPSAAMVGCGSGGNDSNSGTNNSTEGKTLELYYQKTNVDQFQKIVDKRQ